ncbi:hypothetical protein Enr13x_01740 [Stieleria neptunia]|uniref:Transposase IS200-like domain-containing protein n=1 Tax=Stieleria neptunia TaxID=2527979 RepID=A0A518HHQ1_9BACT|nr:hypothetical protein [Stieleria neptunia]QDV40368.1 hypothetical protein Enr13x_01740 [Stieleria neptunia]
MARSIRSEVVDPNDVQISHVISRTTRACWLFGDDPISGKNYDYRKVWIEEYLKRFAAGFGIDLLSYVILSNHFHLMLRSRPDVVATWDDTEVARRWLLICPERKDAEGNPMTPSQSELDRIRQSPEKLAEIRVRLSNISWWMRLLNQQIAQRANKEDETTGHFFEQRFKAIPLVDEEAVLACSVYVDLNLIRACIAETVELSDHSSGQLRVEVVQAAQQAPHGDSKASADGATQAADPQARRGDAFLSPVNLHEGTAPAGPQPSKTNARCSDKGFLAMSEEEYLELLDWSARHLAPGKRGSTPEGHPPILERLGLSPTLWLSLVADFGSLFSTIAGRPERLDAQRTKQTGRRFYVPKQARDLFGQAA